MKKEIKNVKSKKLTILSQKDLKNIKGGRTAIIIDDLQII